MTNEMRTRVEKATEMSEGKLTIEFAKTAIAQKEREISYWNSLPVWNQGYATKCSISAAQADIEYFEAVIEVLTEQAAAQVVAETVQVLESIITVANKVKAVRRAVTTLANKLHKLNYTLSDSFKKAWAFIKAFTGFIPLLS